MPFVQMKINFLFSFKFHFDCCGKKRELYFLWSSIKTAFLLLEKLLPFLTLFLL